MPSDGPAVARLDAVAGFRLVTADLERLTRFYVDTLGFAAEGAAKPIGRDELAMLGLDGGGLRQRLRLGEQEVDLDRFDEPGRPYPGGTAASPWFQHLAIVVDDMAAAFDRVTDAAAISNGGPQRLPPSSGGVTAFKFRDPDGHPLELLQFPADSVPGAWRGCRPAPGAIGLGIDHSAISVSDPAASRSFYGRLGLAAETAGHNEGPEQDRLDGIDDVQVEVVPLRPVSGVPHLELLGYRVSSDRGGVALRINDVAATRIVWRSEGSGLVRDPDGHLHQLVAMPQR